MPDPVEQVFLQAKAPTGTWEGPIQSYWQGRQSALRNRELNLKEEEQATTLPLEAEAKRLLINDAGLSIQLKRDQLERNNQIKAGEGDLMRILIGVGNDPKGWGNPSWGDQLHDLFMRNSALATTPTGESAMKNYLASAAISRGFQRAKEFAAENKLAPVAVKVDERTGEYPDIQYGYTTRERTADQFAPSTIEKLGKYEDANRALAELTNDPDEKARYLERAENAKAQAAQAKAQAAAANARIGQSGQRILANKVQLAAELKDKGYNLSPELQKELALPEITQGPRPLQSGVVTDLQKRSISSANAIDALNKAMGGVVAHPEAFGLVGIASGFAEDVKSQINFRDFVDTPISQVREDAQLAFNAMAPTLRVDTGNMSRYELTQLENAGSTLGINTPAPKAYNKLRALYNVVIGQEMRRLKVQNAPVPDTLLNQISSPQELARMNAQGIPISPALVQRYFQLHPEYDPATGKRR